MQKRKDLWMKTKKKRVNFDNNHRFAFFGCSAWFTVSTHVVLTHFVCVSFGKGIEETKKLSISLRFGSGF